MKLKIDNYTSPVPTEGTFKEVFVEENSITLKGREKRLIIEFLMYYIEKLTVDGKILEQRVNLGATSLEFFGNENDEYNSNRAIIVEIDNPKYTEGGSEPKKIQVKMFKPDYSLNIDLAKPYTMIEWGYPSYQRALAMFSGGSFSSPELQITEPLAKNWILNTLEFKGQRIKDFKFV